MVVESAVGELPAPRSSPSSELLTFLCVATEWDSGHGGLSTFNRELCCALARAGQRVFCLVEQASGEERNRAAAHGVTLVEPRRYPGIQDRALLLCQPAGVDPPVDVVIGHGRITGPAAVVQREERFPRAHRVHFVHMDPTAIEWLKPGSARRDSTMAAEERVNLEVQLGLRASLVMAVGPELRAAYSTYLHAYGTSVEQFLPGLYQDLLEHPPRSLVEAAKKAPEEFLAHVWPWFVDVVRRISGESDGGLAYRWDFSLATRVESGGATHEIAAALETAFSALGRDKPAVIAKLVERWAGEETVAVHRFLMRALAAALPSNAEVAFEYVLGDPRRFVVGDIEGLYAETVRLLKALGPVLDDAAVARVEAAVLKSRSSDEEDPILNVNERRWAHDRNRRHRLRLLRALGPERLSESSGAFVEQETRLFPGVDEPEARMFCGVIGSPMSADEMMRATDDEIVGLFAELPDSTEFKHPRRLLEGGSIEASRALAEVAKRDPERVLKLLPRFQVGTTERPVALCVGALAGVIPLSRLETAILELHRQGFGSEEFRRDACYALERGKKDEEEISLEICNLLESWLEDAGPSSSEPRSVAGSACDEGADPLLFGWWGSGILPRGNFPPLYALTVAYLGRARPDVDGWMGVLERHLERDEVAAVWLALTRQLAHVMCAPADRAERVFERLFDRFPAVRDSRQGTVLIARAMGRVSASAIERWMKAIETSEWPRAGQGFGELLVLLASRHDAPA